MLTTNAPASSLVRALEQQSDAALLEQARSRDRRAADVLFRRYVEYVRRLARRELGDSADVEDVVQNTFLSLFSAIPLLRGQAEFRTYLHRVAINRCIDHLRRMRRASNAKREDTDEALHARPYDLDEVLHARRRLREVELCLDHMTPKKRTALLLRVCHGLSLREIGAATSSDQNTVSKRVRFAQKELAASLGATPVVRRARRDARSGPRSRCRSTGNQPPEADGNMP